MSLGLVRHRHGWLLIVRAAQRPSCRVNSASSISPAA
jgi:hypothetical protein